jgi:hypothetical protein
LYALPQISLTTLSGVSGLEGSFFFSLHPDNNSNAKIIDKTNVVDFFIILCPIFVSGATVKTVYLFKGTTNFQIYAHVCTTFVFPFVKSSNIITFFSIKPLRILRNAKKVVYLWRQTKQNRHE